MSGELTAYIIWVPAVLIMLFIPGLILWGLSRLIRKIEAGALFGIFIGILCTAAAAAIFHGLPHSSQLLESPSKIFDQNYFFWLRITAYIFIVTLIVYYLLGMGLWLRSILVAVVFCFLMFLVLKIVHGMLSSVGAYKVLSG